jgi:hypothetical protein
LVELDASGAIISEGTLRAGRRAARGPLSRRLRERLQ